MGRPAAEVSVRRWRMEGIPGIIDCNQGAYADYRPEYVYTQRQHEMQLNAFPDGQVVAIAGSRVVGSATSLVHRAMHIDGVRETMYIGQHGC